MGRDHGRRLPQQRHRDPRRYLELAQSYRGEDEQTDWVLQEWESTLDGLAKDPMEMADRLDWVAKHKIIEAYRAEEGLDWDDDALHSVDLEYHNIDPAKSLYYGWEEVEGVARITDDLDIVDSMTDPPTNTRAKGRAKMVKELLERRNPKFYLFDWNGCALDRHSYIEMPDPFETYD